MSKEVIERAAKAMALHAGWEKWESAKNCGDTLSGNDPEDERQYWIGLASVALTQAAANKAAEEGGLEQRDLMIESLLDLMSEWNEAPRGEDAAQVFNRVESLIDSYVEQAIEADLASRQVANKAEVELVAEDVRNAVHALIGPGFHIGLAGLDIASIISKLATPPATTGESTALADMEARKDAAYYERNQVVAALAKCFPSGVAKTAIEGWSEDWHGCVYIDLPTGQASWHFHDSHAHMFDGLPAYVGGWDGHSTDEKYARLAALKPVGASTVLTDERIMFEQAERESDMTRDVEGEDYANPCVQSAWEGWQARAKVAAQAGQVAVPEGFVLVPMVPTTEMSRAMSEDEWHWEDLLAAAGAITDDEYNYVANAPSPAKESK